MLIVSNVEEHELPTNQQENVLEFNKQRNFLCCSMFVLETFCTLLGCGQMCDQFR